MNVVVLSILGEGIELSDVIACIRYILYVYSIIMKLRLVNVHFHLRLSSIPSSRRIPLPMHAIVNKKVCKACNPFPGKNFHFIFS